MSSAPATQSTFAALRLAAADIKLAHTVFALPFAVLGAFLARDPHEGWGRFGGRLALVVGCMFLARTWAMLINRIVDARFDAAHQRTAGRAVASGRLSRPMAVGLCAASGAGFMALCWLFLYLCANRWPIVLGAPVLAWLALYSFAKRFTVLCHLLLGSALAISPLAAALAVRPASLGEVPALYWLAGMVTLWVAGFDILYALQDEAFDRATGLFSIPARLGRSRAVAFSRLLHILAAAALWAAALTEPRFGPVFFGAAAGACVLLITEHAVLQRRGLAGLPLAFFTMNGVISIIVGAAGVADTVS